MTAPVLVSVPVPDAVRGFVGCELPKHITAALDDAEASAYTVVLSRGPLYAVAREVALADLAFANKILAAHNPGLIVRPGAVR